MADQKEINIYSLYKKEMRQCGMINDDEARECVRMFQNGTKSEKEKSTKKVINSFQLFVHSIACKYTNGSNVLDLVNEGSIGLVDAMERFDLDSDNKFITYAGYWVKKRIQGYMAITEPMIVPKNVFKLNSYAPIIRQEFWFKNERNPTAEELRDLIEERYGVTFNNLEDFEPTQAVSIYGSSVDDDGEEVYDEMPSFTRKTASCNIEEFEERDYNHDMIVRAMGCLNNTEKYVIQSLYGLNGCEPKFKSSLADEMNVCEERIRQIVKNGMKKMKQALSVAC